MLRVGLGRTLGTIRPGIRMDEEEAAPAADEFLLLEDGDFFLLESGDKILLESAA